MSLTHEYIPRIPQREENLFLEEYYSGTDAKVYIDDGKQTEISYISYSVNEQLKPIYGYASRTFDDVSVGNRIVTGVIKIPIKNPEDQASYKTVVGSALSTVEEIEKKNATESKNKKNVEWTNNTSKSSSGSSSYSNNEVFEYQNKLIKLGYNSSTTGHLDKATITALKKFQEEHSLSVSNYFNNDTKSEIDLEIELSGITKKAVNSSTKVYYGLSTTMGVVTTLNKDDKVYIIKDFKNGFVQVRTIDGKDGYIESSRLS